MKHREFTKDHSERIRQSLCYAEEKAKMKAEVEQPIREAEHYLEERGFQVLGFVRETP